MIKIVVADEIDAEGLEPLRANNTFSLVFVIDPAQLKREIAEADALLVRSKTKVKSELLDLGKRLKFIGRCGVGVDNIDVDCASKKGIVVVNVPGGNTISAAEHTLALILSLSKNVPQADLSMKNGLWEREKFVGTELHGKVLGLLGFGRVGKEVAKRALSFGLEVFAYDPYVSENQMKSLGVKADTVQGILERSDYISLHLPLTAETKGIINDETLAKMKADCRLINCARGELVDENALIRALREKKIKGAALDVFAQEPPKNSDLLHLENVILTPHLGASTEEAQLKVAQELAYSLRDFFGKSAVRNAVNLPVTDPEMFEQMSPYLALSEKIGRFISQLVPGVVEEVKIEICGDFSLAIREYITVSALKGILSTYLGDTGVNWVNATPIAKERGIRIESSAVSKVEDYTSLITVKIRASHQGLSHSKEIGGGTNPQSKSVSGTIFSLRNPRIVRIDDLTVDLIPAGHLIVLTNRDRPGVVGFIGTVLGENQVNIAEFQVGRKNAGGEAVSILHVDSPVSPDVIEKIRNFPGITNVRVAHLPSD